MNQKHPNVLGEKSFQGRIQTKDIKKSRKKLDLGQLNKEQY